ncbi:MAG TPA: hypothetical protein VLA77_04175 [Candidatus Saccharimonadales bacterium]|nr:hypothetical protein [Candidatus Saccharimonadales bacterium]
MLKTTLVKICGSTDLAHLYEHLFYDALVQFMTDRGLVSRLDYFIHGRAFAPGLIHFDIDLYTEEAQSIKNDLTEQRINTDDPSVAVALLQLMSENKTLFHGNKKIFEALAKVDEQPWQNLDLLNTLDLSAKIHDDPNINFNPTKEELITSTLKLTLSAEILEQKLTPLFIVVGRIILSNLENTLMDTYGYYAFGESGRKNSTSLGLSSLFRASSKHRLKLTEELSDCKETLEWLNGIDFANKAHRHLTSLNIHLPDELEIYDASKLLIGRIGWRNIATKSNIQKVLEAAKLNIKYNKEDQELELSQIFRN